MYKTTSKNSQTRKERGLKGSERPDGKVMFRIEKQKAERRARKEAKKGPMQQLKDSWDD